MQAIKTQIPKLLIEALGQQNAYLVGGAIRDYLLGCSEIKDFDFVIFDLDNLENFCQNLADQTDSSFVKLDVEQGIYRIVNHGWQADFAKPRGIDLKQDLLGRDFTINALGYDWRQNQIIDPTNGQTDLQNKIIRAISERNLQDDPLRLLRAFRFACQKEFEIEEKTQNYIIKNAHLISQTAAERISFELWSLLEQEQTYKYLQSLLQVGLLEIIFPEFTPLRQVPPNDFHHLPLIEHTFELVKQYETQVKTKLPKLCLENLQNTNLSGFQLSAILKMGCLFHDLGKPATWKIIEGKHTFYGHDALGEEITENIGKRLNWSKQITNCLKQLVLHHLRPFNIAPQAVEPTEKAERRFFRQLNINFYPLIALAWADLLSIRGPAVTEEIINNNEKRLINLLENYYAFTQKEETEPLLLSGNKLVEAITIAQLPPSKVIKELLFELRELQFSKQINSPEQAFEWFVQKGQSLKKV